MSRRINCCCDPDPEGDICFTFSVSAKHWQDCTLSVATPVCTVTLPEPCGEVDSFGVVNTYTLARGDLQPQPIVVAAPDPEGGFCWCGTPCTYTWTPEIGFERSICFKMNGLGTQCFGCPEIIDSYPPQGTLGNTITVTIGGPLLCPQPHGCCGPGRYYIPIIYTAIIPSTILTGECGDVQIGSPAFPIWSTRYEFWYCWEPSNPCTMSLARMEVVSTSRFNPSYGPGAFGTDDCDCNTNSVNTCDSAVMSGSKNYPFTGDWATAYASAGSPPVTLSCGSCKC